METKFTSIIDDVLKDFPPGGRFLLSYLSDFELNEWRSGCFVSFSLAGCLFIPTVAHERGMCRHTSNYDKMIFSRLDEIEALDADDIIKRMHVNDLMENTGDDLRNNYQGQYLDGETGLAYNRFRYYSPETGAYISQDPIRLEAGLTNLYAYVHDVNAWVDPWGLKGKAWFNYAKRWHDKRADEIFGVGKGRSVSGRHYDKTYKGRDIEFKSDNFSKGPRSKDSLERMQKQLDKDIQNKKMGSC